MGRGKITPVLSLSCAYNFCIHDTGTLVLEYDDEMLLVGLSSIVTLLLALVYRWITRRQLHTKVLITGLDAVGKSTLLYKLRVPITVQNPKHGFHVERAMCGGIELVCFDLGGSDVGTRIMPDQRALLQGANALLFVHDAADTDRLPQAADFLHLLLSEEALAAPLPVLLLLNKQDLKSAIDVAAAARAFRLAEPREDQLCLRGRPTRIQPACTTTMDGVVEGLEWLRTIEVEHRTDCHA